jgi:uncharacterized membrane protein
MDWLLAIPLFLHVGGAILGFGPTYAFLFLGPMAGREPPHANFALRFQQRVATRLVIPLAVLQGVTGLLLLWRIGFDLLQRGWLIVAIVLYLIALAIAFGVMLPTLRRLVELTSGPPPAPPPGSPPPSGPPPHVAALVRRGRLAGMTNATLILVIVFLMVTKPF